MKKRFLNIVVILLCYYSVRAQNDTSLKAGMLLNNSKQTIIDSTKQRDLVDVLQRVFNKKTSLNGDKPKKLNFSLLPSAGYSLSTGFAANLSSNVEFYTGPDKSKVNVSVINASGFIDTYNQRSFLFQTNIWANNNNYNITTDFRWLKYPGDTYGLGSLTNDGSQNHLNYNYVKFYETVFRKILPDYYVGIGYNLDYHCNITQEGNIDGSVSDFEKYGHAYTSRSSGISFGLLYDKRGNPVNPLSGGYANIIYRHNYQFLGSDVPWESLIVDLRKYIKLSPNNNNILALWSYNWFTFNGQTPYLDLPSTGWDPYGSSGRGYAEGRFRGKDMLYAEAEFRFGITHNGLLGGVLFTNAQSFPEYPTGDFKKIIPAAGTGLRIKLNKHSNTNICVDYGIGIDGSHGFFVNLGEGF